MSNINRRPKDNQNSWNFFFSVFFLSVLIGTLVFLDRNNALPHRVPVFDAILMAFAAFRITRLVVYDKIMRWFRELFMDKRLVQNNGGELIETYTTGFGIRTTINDLLQCPWCISFWSSLLISFSYFYFDWAWFVIFFLALAGAGSLLQLIANSIGWRAENLKLDSLSKEKSQKPIDTASLGE